MQRLSLVERGDARQHAALEKLEEGAARGGHVADPRPRTPACCTAAIVSPPPITENAPRVRRPPAPPPSVPAANGALLEHAHGPVPDDGPAPLQRGWRTGRRSPGRCRGPSDRPGSRGRPRCARPLVASRPGAATTSTGSRSGMPRLARPLEHGRAPRPSRSGSTQRAPDAVAQRLEERVRHRRRRSASPSTRSSRCSTSAELVGDLGAAEHGHERRSACSKMRAERLELPRHEQPAAAGVQVAGDARGRGVRAVGRRRRRR